MRVLVLESHPGVARAAIDELTAAGHTVVRCDSPDRSLPCRGVVPDQDCPLDAPVDVAIVAQEPGTAAVEHGALCAVRSRVPLVEVTARGSASASSPYAGLAVRSGRDVVRACERAARDGRAHADAVVRELLRMGVLERHELDPEEGTIGVHVERSTGRLAMTLVLDARVADRERELVRAAEQALRAYDRGAAVISVAVRRVATR